MGWWRRMWWGRGKGPHRAVAAIALSWMRWWLGWREGSGLCGADVAVGLSGGEGASVAPLLLAAFV